MKKKPINQAQLLMRKHLNELGLDWQEEVLFHPIRKWRWDFGITMAGESTNLAIEICGQIWHKGGHSSGKGIQRDYDKANAGTMLGWRVLHFSTNDVLHGRAKAFLAEHLRA